MYDHFKAAKDARIARRMYETSGCGPIAAHWHQQALSLERWLRSCADNLIELQQLQQTP
jgi:hypothetical protein